MRFYSRKTAYGAIILGLLAYLLIVVIQMSVLRRPQEIFPFFSWSLFSSVRDERFLHKTYLTVTEIDGQSLGPTDLVYTVGTSGIRFQKIVTRINGHCSRYGLSACQAKAIGWLHPFLQDIEFDQAVTVVPSVCKVNPQTYMETLRKGLTTYPKFVDCDELIELGPFTLSRQR